MTTFTTLMKKVFLTIMAFVYLAAASGMSINFHYCMDKLVDVSMTSQHSEECPACKQENPSSEHQLSCKCCKDELKQVKVEKDHKAEQTIAPKFSFAQIPNTYYANDFSITIPTTLIGSYNINGPPPQSSKVPTFLINCVFRI